MVENTNKSQNIDDLKLIDKMEHQLKIKSKPSSVQDETE